MAILSLALLPADLSGGVSDWLYFTRGTEEFALDLYARHPEIQIGPAALFVAVVLRDSLIAARLLIMAIGVASVLLLEKAAVRARGSDELVGVCSLLGGLALIIGWNDLVEVAHLDDALALGLTALAIYAIARGQPVLGGTAVGLAVLAKPWGLVVAPMLLGLSGARLGLIIAGSIGLLGWVPFLAADASSLDAARFRIPVSPQSGLRVLGVDDQTAPAWIRPLQLGLASVFGLVAAVRGRWAAVPFVGFATRVALDAGTHSYYEAGLLLGALAWDQMVGRTRLPIWTAAIFLLHQRVWTYLTESAVSGVVPLLLVPALLAALLFSEQHAHDRKPPSGG